MELGVLVLQEKHQVRDRHGRWHLYQKPMVTPEGTTLFRGAAVFGRQGE